MSSVNNDGCGWCESAQRIKAIGVCERCFRTAPEHLQEALWA